VTRSADSSVIRTERLERHTVRPADYELLALDRADPRLWTDRGFTNPYGYLVEDAGPLPYRLPMVRTDPSQAPYLLRIAVLPLQGAIIGGAGFHALPDAAGAIEIGFEVCAPMRRNGYGLEMLHGMWDWVIEQPDVRILRYSVGVENVASQRIVRGLGFTHMGVQQDEIDGPEDVFEMSVEAYRIRRGT
jgi:ribosomal-protein-alanine N-acetyltransferase